MYAVFKAGAHQYRAQEGDTVVIDRIQGEEGDVVNFSQVLMLGNGADAVVGSPLVAKASVEAVIKEQKRNPKIIVFKFRRRKNSQRKRGHKQPITVVEIKKIHA